MLPWQDIRQFNCHKKKVFVVNLLAANFGDQCKEKTMNETEVSITVWEPKQSCISLTGLTVYKQLLIVKMYGKTCNIICFDYSANDNSDGALNKFDTDISVHFSGKNRWLAPVIFKSTCKINVAFFPFDEQVVIIYSEELACNYNAGFLFQRPSSNAVLHMSRIECKWEISFVLPYQHSIRFMWSTASEPGKRQSYQTNWENIFGQPSLYSVPPQVADPEFTHKML